jgi:hypothetical protein
MKKMKKKKLTWGTNDAFLCPEGRDVMRLVPLLPLPLLPLPLLLLPASSSCYGHGDGGSSGGGAHLASFGPVFILPWACCHPISLSL